MNARAQPDPIGSVIAGRFRVEGPLGAGGMAHVVRAKDLATGRFIAVKLLKPEIAKDEQAVARLRREGEVLSKLDHPAIVGIETFGKLDDGRIFIAMELLEGETLGERVRRQGRLTPAELTPIITGAAAGLGAAHRNEVIHRDLKPDNVFLSGDPMQVKLLDFGISKVFGFAKLTRTGQILGTPRYMAPEQLAADDDVDQRIDVYAMGVIVYEALAGTPPFGGVNASELIVQIIRGKAPPLSSYCPDIDPNLEAVVMRAMSRSREARFDNALDLAEAWVATASPRPEKSGAKAALATSFFGGMEAVAFAETMAAESSPPPSPSSPPGPPEGLRAGTFPEMEERKDIAPPASGGWTGAEEPPPTAGAIPRHVARNAVQEQRAHEAPHFEPAQLQEASGTHAAAAPPAPEPSAAYTPVVPTRPTWLLVVLALIGGALSAALVLYFLNAGGEGEQQDTPRPQESPPLLGGTEPAPPVEEPEPTMESEPAEGVLPPEPPPEAAPSEMAAAMRRATRTSMAVEERGPRTTGAILADARQALSVGNTSACLGFLDEMGPRRTAGALKLEGDCHQRAGDLGEALRTYTRYCSVFPDGPAIDEVRGRVEAAGGRCP